MGYLFDLHCHNKEGSVCSRLPAKDMVDFYIKQGYSGFCVTNHFTGSTTVPDNYSWEDRVDHYFTGYDELVYCGYGEPTCALENLLESASYAKEKYGIKVRLNTNGLANLYHKRNIVPELAKVVDSVSISLNAPTAEKYQKVTRPQFENAFPALPECASLAQETFAHTQFSIVDVLPKEEIEACQKIADERGIYLKIRKFS